MVPFFWHMGKLRKQKLPSLPKVTNVSNEQNQILKSGGLTKSPTRSPALPLIERYCLNAWLLRYLITFAITIIFLQWISLLFLSLQSLEDGMPLKKLTTDLVPNMNGLSSPASMAGITNPRGHPFQFFLVMTSELFLNTVLSGSCY